VAESPDPDAELPGPEIDENGVDLTQIRAMLALTPVERLQRATQFTNALLAMRALNESGRPS
jgi:hypothetical protein